MFIVARIWVEARETVLSAPLPTTTTRTTMKTDSLQLCKNVLKGLHYLCSNEIIIKFSFVHERNVSLEATDLKVKPKNCAESLKNSTTQEYRCNSTATEYFCSLVWRTKSDAKKQFWITHQQMAHVETIWWCMQFKYGIFTWCRILQKFSENHNENRFISDCRIFYFRLQLRLKHSNNLQSILFSWWKS